MKKQQHPPDPHWIRARLKRASRQILLEENVTGPFWGEAIDLIGRFFDLAYENTTEETLLFMEELENLDKRLAGAYADFSARKIRLALTMEWFEPLEADFGNAT